MGRDGDFSSIMVDTVIYPHLSFFHHISAGPASILPSKLISPPYTLSQPTFWVLSYQDLLFVFISHFCLSNGSKSLSIISFSFLSLHSRIKPLLLIGLSCKWHPFFPIFFKLLNFSRIETAPAVFLLPSHSRLCSYRCWGAFGQRLHDPTNREARGKEYLSKADQNSSRRHTFCHYFSCLLLLLLLLLFMQFHEDTWMHFTQALWSTSHYLCLKNTNTLYTARLNIQLLNVYWVHFNSWLISTFFYMQGVNFSYHQYVLKIGFINITFTQQLLSKSQPFSVAAHNKTKLCGLVSSYNWNSINIIYKLFSVLAVNFLQSHLSRL